MTSSGTHDFNDTNTLDFKHKNSLDIILTNARSLLPKLSSLVENMQELDCEIAIATETWFQDGKQLDRALTDIESGYGYAVVKRNRRGARGGGVAIVYKRGDIVMQEIKTCKDYVVVAAIARRTGQRRKIATIAVYIPPNYTAEDNKNCLNTSMD